MERICNRIHNTIGREKKKKTNTKHTALTTKRKKEKKAGKLRDTLNNDEIERKEAYADRKVIQQTRPYNNNQRLSYTKTQIPEFKA